MSTIPATDHLRPIVSAPPPRAAGVAHSVDSFGGASALNDADKNLDALLYADALRRAGGFFAASPLPGMEGVPHHQRATVDATGTGVITEMPKP